MSVNQRLDLLIKSSKLSQSEFSRRIGKSRQSVNNILQGESLPSFSFIEGIINAFPLLNLQWLLKGEGEIWLPGDDMITQTNQGNGSNYAQVNHAQEPPVQYDRKAYYAAELKASQEKTAQLEAHLETMTQNLADKAKLIAMLEAEVKRLKSD